MQLGQAALELSSGKISSVELVSNCLSQIEKKDGEYGCYLEVAKEQALKEAKISDERRQKGNAIGPLDGIPLGIKDMIGVVGMHNTAASKILEGYRPVYDATVISRLKAQGAIMLGKLNQDEFAMGSSNETSAYKLCKNPWDKTKTPGGSSGGSAACLPLGMALGSLGTDTGGSVRQPAAFCGVVGLKPTYGRVSRYGVVAFASSLDQVGPMACDTQGVAMLLKAIAGHDKNDATSSEQPVPDYTQSLTKPLQGLKIGLPKEYRGDGIDPEVRENLDRTIQILKQKGCIIKDISLPHTPYAVSTYYIISSAEASSNLSRYDGIRYGPRLGEDEGLLAVYEKTRGRLFGTEVKRRIILGAYVLSSGFYDAYYTRAQKVRRLFQQDFYQAFSEVDIILSPTTPTTAFSLGEKVTDPLKMYLNDIFTIAAPMAGIPAISVPSGFSKQGMPIGMQLMGRHFDEATLLQVSSALEKELDLPRLV